MQRLHRKRFTAGIALAVIALLAAACSSSSSTSSGSSSSSLSGTLNGSGSSFQLLFQQSAIQQFKTLQPNITVNYGGGGSGKGRSDLAAGVVQYAGSDSPIPPTETANFKGKTVLYFPVFLGPITVSYNLPGVSSGLKLTPTVIAEIFQGKITKWNDSAITSLNSGVKLPSTPISLAVRADSSGTTANFSLFLMTAVPSVWKLGSSSTISWPSSAHAGNGNGGVAQIVKSTPGAIGYVDYADAKSAALTFASVQNKSGSYVAPSTASASAAGTTVTVAPDLTFHAVWSSDPSAYPITYQSWVLVYQKQSSSNTTKMLKAYIGYLLGSGQSLLAPLGYAPLPTNILNQAKAQLSKIGT
jgi:phosphate transport system substrate-binding protein